MAAVVKSVEYSAQGVKVTTTDGTAYAGKYAILTPSLGCLKDGDITFSPALPNYKMKAIQVGLWAVVQLGALGACAH